MTDLVSVYSNYKCKKLSEYLNLVSKIISVDHKKILGNRKRALEILDGISKIYNDKYLFIKEVRYDLSKMFVESDYIEEYNFTKEVNAISDYFIKNNIIFDLVKNEPEIILMATYIQMAYKLDILSSKILENDINYNDEITKIIEYYHKIHFIFLIDDGKKYTKELVELVKKDAVIEKELYETLTNKNSFNKYIKIDQLKDIYITQYNYYIEDLEKYDSVQSRKIYFEKNVDDDYTVISAQLAVNSLVKQLQSRKKTGMFLIPIKKKFLTKEKNIKDYKKLLDSDTTRSKLKLLINYNEVNDKLIVTLKQNNLDYYIYCNKGAVIDKIDNTTNYIFSKEFLKNNQIIVTGSKNIIIESINIFMEDEDFIFRRERENN